MSVMSWCQKSSKGFNLHISLENKCILQSNRETNKPFFRRCILRAFINLLPKRQLIVSAGVALEGNSCHIVEHEIRELKGGNGEQEDGAD